jgi:UDP-2,3-diacylglucosamine pyrophosphatase LpxH
LIKVTAVLISVLCLAAQVSRGETPAGKPVAANHHSSNDTATIRVDGLKKPVVVLHITDSHISIGEQGADQYRQYIARMDDAYGKARPHYRTKKTALPAEHFRELMAFARQCNVDLIALTGDIVNNPSQASVQYVCQALKDTGIRNLYISGNHDWHYEGMVGTDEALRETWIKERLLPLYTGRDPLYSAVQLGGINFVAIDNSTYQVDAEQLAFYEQQVAGGLPTVLLIHIPIWLPQNAGKHVSECGDPRWGWDTDSNYKIERRERWSKSGNSQSTMDFVNRVKNTGNLIAVLAGHLHHARTDQLSASAVQYVTQAACDGACRLVTFEPNTSAHGK